MIRRLVDRIRGGGRQSGGAPVEDTYLAAENAHDVPDSELPNLPPVARSHGWGDMSWLRRDR
jgi:hypothetical protein